MKACALCKMKGCPWDEIDGCPCCPDCLEGLVAGEIEAVKFSIIRSARCCICRMPGAVRFVTVPLRTPAHMVTTLGFCPLHLRALVGRGRYGRFLLLRVFLTSCGGSTYTFVVVDKGRESQDVAGSAEPDGMNGSAGVTRTAVRPIMSIHSRLYAENSNQTKRS